MLSALSGLIAVTLSAAELQWTTSLPKAIEQAKKENKLVVANFTGSDWCGFCIKQEKEVFSQEEFIKYAKENLVMVMLDFPRKKLPEELAKANGELKDKYGIRGYPTLVFINGAGKEVGRKIGYGGGGPKAVIEEIEKARAKN
jgi:thioredoxin-related protein